MPNQHLASELALFMWNRSSRPPASERAAGQPTSPTNVFVDATTPKRHNVQRLTSTETTVWIEEFLFNQLYILVSFFFTNARHLVGIKGRTWMPLLGRASGKRKGWRYHVDQWTACTSGERHSCIPVLISGLISPASTGASCLFSSLKKKEGDPIPKCYRPIPTVNLEWGSSKADWLDGKLGLSTMDVSQLYHYSAVSGDQLNCCIGQ